MICKVSDIASSAFSEPHRALKKGEYSEIVAKGGRGSAKSSWASVEGILLIVKNPEIHGVVIRKVANTLRASVFSQYQWAVSALGLDDKFRSTVSPMEIIYKKTGQKIHFFGADDPGKLKSLKVPFGYIGYLHFEELDQFASEEEVRNIEQSVLRGGPLAFEIKTFNPPKTRDNWANEYCLLEKPGQLIHHSTYETTPAEWLGAKFLSSAEHLMSTNPKAYEHEYLGIPVGTGGAVFENIAERSISDSEISRFDRLKFGIDFGFAVDEFAWVKLHYDRRNHVLYILDEIYEQRLSNRSAVEKIKRKHRGSMQVVADSAEPKSIAEMQSLGLSIIGARKGPDSVEYGFKFMQDMTEIVIDKSRTPNAYKEFTLYEYEQNKNGKYISAYPDKNDHILSACRYALESEMRQSRFFTSNFRT